MSTHPLLEPLTDPQRAVVDIVSAVWLREVRFPVYGYVEREMDRKGLALEAVLPTFPGIGQSQFGPRYRAVWWDSISKGAPERPVGLTIAGLHWISEARGTVSAFLAALSFTAQRRVDAVGSPFQADDVVITEAELRDAILPGKDPNLIERPFKAALGLFEYEPPTAGGPVWTPDGQNWSCRCVRETRHFLGVQGVPDYLDRLSTYLEPVAAEVPVVLEEPPLALAAELDFLDTAWQLRNGTAVRLLALPGASAVTGLSQEATTAADFDSRMSNLGQVLKGFNLTGIPGRQGRQHPVQRLVDHLKSELGDGAARRLDEADAILEAAVTIRNGTVHRNAAADAVRALGVLGVPYPVTDWTAAWRAIRSGVARAIATLREEIRAND